MNPFKTYFSETAIIRELCKARIKLAKLRHDRQFFYNIRPGRSDPATLEPKAWGPIKRDIFPPRRQWHRFRPILGRRGERASTSLNLDTLFRATLVLKTRQPEAEWARKLDAVVSRIQSRALESKSFRFSKPIIMHREKTPGGHEYRPLVQFVLEDKVIDCLTAKYLRESVDSLFRDSCLAFRCGTKERSVPTIHDALARLLSANRLRPRKGSFIAECDIKGFFDCVPHQLVRQSLKQLVRQARRIDCQFELDKRALTIFRAYLAAYAFSKDVYGPSAATKELQKQDRQGTFKWPEKELRRLHKKKTFPRIGVPQGGALSCFIANLVLHKADAALERWKGKRLLYMRYCDDMILVASDRKICKAAFDRYCRILRGLRMPVHAPQKVEPYLNQTMKRKFWDHKSNSVYRWATPIKGGVPWIQFVGYQVRYDALVRVRPKSLKKEFKKIRHAATELSNMLMRSKKNTIRKSEHEIKHRFRMKLISMAVGRRKLSQQIEGPLPMCWTNGFKGLLGKDFLPHLLKGLDRYREHHVKRTERRLRRMRLAKNTDKKKVRAQKFYGHPFSYLAQFRPYDTQKAPGDGGVVKANRKKLPGK